MIREIGRIGRIGRIGIGSIQSFQSIHSLGNIHSIGHSLAFSTVKRPAIVSVMGHVDHGKTSLLDYIRQTNVAAKEAGGITQHIGAFHYATPTHSITFFDTPGHEAFSQMRKRGVSTTDIVVLVVSLDDGVMPQTEECIKLVQQNPSVALVVALNKYDKYAANLGRVQQALLKSAVQLEAFGGEVQCVPISATLGTNVDKLLECIQAQAEVMDLQADENFPVSGTVIETKTQEGLGTVASVICLAGTLRLGDYLVAGREFCRVRSIRNCAGVACKFAKPGIPVEIAGWRGIPAVGERIVQVASEKDAEKATSAAEDKFSEKELALVHAYTEKTREKAKSILHEIKAAEKAGIPLKKRFWDLDVESEEEILKGIQVMRILLVVDVAGSEEALTKCIQKIPQSKVRIEIVKCSFGALIPNDIELARALNASIFTFNLPTPLPPQITKKLQSMEVKCFHHRIIYDFVDGLKEQMLSALPTLRIPTVQARCQVKQVFAVEVKNKKVHVAGCKVLDAGAAFQKISHAERENRYVRVVRKGEIVADKTFVTSLRHLKDEVSSVAKGTECGVILDGFGDYLPDDVIEVVKLVPQPQSL